MMGVGRREFLRLIGLAAGGIALNPSLAVVTTRDLYINRQMGILFHKPATWGFVKVTNFGKLKEQQILGNGLNDMKEEVWEELGDPVCIITRYHQDLPEHRGVFSPTITLNITPKKEIDLIGYTNLKDVIEASAEGTANILSGFTIIERHEPYVLSGSVFHEFKAKYLFEHQELEGLPLEVELTCLKAEHNGCYYDFNFHQSKAQAQIADAEFESFRKSIKLL